MTELTKVLSVHVKRAKARDKERDLQAQLDAGAELTDYPWARGVRVETTMGGLLHAVVLTSHRGH
jgi:hypothetical protein